MLLYNINKKYNEIIFLNWKGNNMFTEVLGEKNNVAF